MRLSRQYVAAMVVLLSVTLFLHLSSHAEDPPARPGFTTFPLELKGQDHGGIKWIGHELFLEPDILAVLKVDDYMMRAYVPAHEEGPFLTSRLTAPVSLYTGYYRTQRTGVTYHSPLNCLPGSGWNIISREVVPVAVGPGGERRDLRVNKVVIQKGLETQLILYWYQDRGRIITSEYWAKMYLLWDAMTRNRTDGALVRLSVPVAASVANRLALEEAFASAEAFLREAYPRLVKHLPV